jgi:phospholipid/cholesterol/gamma-HCH transport system permease protein
LIRSALPAAGRAGLETLGGVSLLALDALRALARGGVPWRELARSIDEVAVRSSSIVALTALFTGLVLALQTGVGLQRFGAARYTGYVVGLAVVREIGPVLTALIVGGRVGGGIAAEIASMQVTDQVDALRAMGADPVRKLVVPRVLACALALPLLTALADVLGILGGVWTASTQFGLSPHYFLETVRQTVRISDLLSGLAKTAFFGCAIALIACYMGLTTSGGTAGVGRTTTRAVVTGSVAVLVLNFFLTKLFLLLWG